AVPSLPAGVWSPRGSGRRPRLGAGGWADVHFHVTARGAEAGQFVDFLGTEAHVGAVTERPYFAPFGHFLHFVRGDAQDAGGVFQCVVLHESIPCSRRSGWRLSGGACRLGKGVEVMAHCCPTSSRLPIISIVNQRSLNTSRLNTENASNWGTGCRSWTNFSPGC